MADVYGDSSLKYSTGAKWLAEFKRGLDSLENDLSVTKLPVRTLTWMDARHFHQNISKGISVIECTNFPAY